jgi:hypothetical protein
MLSLLLFLFMGAWFPLCKGPGTSAGLEVGSAFRDRVWGGLCCTPGFHALMQCPDECV